MKILRYINDSWHHYAVQFPEYNIVREWETYKNQKADKKFSYISEFFHSEENPEMLVAEIKKHLTVANHVYVNIGEPGMSYKDGKKYPTIDGQIQGPYHDATDFINDNFSADDRVTFFGNAVLHKKTTRPWFYFNDCFFAGIELYKNDSYCAKLLSKIQPIDPGRKYVWEMMCSRKTNRYEQLKQHPVDKSTFSTCHALGVQSFSSHVVAPMDNNPGSAAGLENPNIRCSDLIDPDIYNSSYFSVVLETVVPEANTFSMFSEKEAKPIIAKRPFLIGGSQNHLKAFRSLGFKSFNDVFDESYDDEPNETKRFAMMLDEMHRISQLDPLKVYEKLFHVLDHNKKHFENEKNWNKEFQEAWNQNQ